MTEAVLRFIDNSGISHAYLLVLAAGFVLGTIAWFAWGAGRILPEDGPHKRDANMRVSEFLERLTLHSTHGRLFLWSSAANLALAAALPFLGGRLPDATVLAAWAALWPLFLFIYHLTIVVRYGSTWLTAVLLATVALTPVGLGLRQFGIR